MLSPKRQCSSTAVRVTQPKAKGFVLMQLGQPVTFATRAPTLSERKYSQIRKELLAQVFGMEDNHHHVYVQKIILWTDHKPFSLHFTEARAITFQEATAPTVAASTI